MSEQNKETAGIITTGANMAKHFEVWVKPGKVEVITIEGTGEIYVDKECKWGAVPDKTKTIEVEPGKHRVGVYMGGQFAYDQDVTVPEDGDPVLVGIVDTTKDSAEEAKPEEPKLPEEAKPEGPKLPETMTVKTQDVCDLIAELRDLADFLTERLPKPEAAAAAEPEPAPQAEPAPEE